MINLSDFRGKNVVLVFYVNHAWQPCLRQLGELQKRVGEIRELDAEVIAISSIGGRADVERTQKVLGITFPLIYGPNRKVAEEFGVYNAERKWAIATFILDKEGMIRFKHAAKHDEDRPSFTKIIDVLKEIK
jgi:peroxiredoxin